MLSMRGLRVSSSIFALFLATGAFAQVVPSEPGTQPAPAEPARAAGPRATNLEVEAYCSATKAGERMAIFTWMPSARAARSRIDVTQYYDGFTTNRFETIGVVEGARARFEWSGGRPGIDYLWRVMTYSDGRWNASESARYLVLVCPVDRPGEPGRSKPR
jgi:hypothetical protein